MSARLLSTDTRYKHTKFYRELLEMERVRHENYVSHGTRVEDWGFDLLKRSIPKSKSEIEKKFSIELEKIPGSSHILIRQNTVKHRTGKSLDDLARTLWVYFVDTYDYLPLFVIEGLEDRYGPR